MADIPELNPLRPVWPVRPGDQPGRRKPPEPKDRDEPKERRREPPHEDGDEPMIDEYA